MIDATHPPGAARPAGTTRRITSTRARTAWRAAGTAVTVFAVASLTWSGVNQLALRTDTVRSTVDAATGIDDIVVHGDSVEVAVHGVAESDEVVATATIREAFTRPTFSVRRRGSTVHVTARCATASPSCVRRLRLDVPSELAVSVALDAGPVTVTGLAGPADVTVDDGDVQLVGVRGRANVTTDVGDIGLRAVTSEQITIATDTGSIDVDAAASPSTLRVTTDTGDIAIDLPSSDDRSGVDFAVNAESDSGTVATLIRTNPTSRRSIVATSDSGDITMAYRG